MFNLPYCPYCRSCFIYLDLLLRSVVIVYRISIKFYRHRVNGRPKLYFSCRFQILPASCKRELIFQGGIKFCRFQILPASCKRELIFQGGIKFCHFQILPASCKRGLIASPMIADALRQWYGMNYDLMKTKLSNESIIRPLVDHLHCKYHFDKKLLIINTTLRL